MTRRLVSTFRTAGLAAAAAACIAPAAAATAAPEPGADAPTVLRLSAERGKSVRLDTSVQVFRPAGGAGPSVLLVGVTHIADGAYYDALQKLLDDCDLVLYESVGPAGTGGARGDTAAERVESTEAGMRFVGQMAAMSYERSATWADDAEALAIRMNRIDPRLGDYTERAALDAWGRPVSFDAAGALDGTEDANLIIRSLGADGVPGGTGEDRDLMIVVGPADVEAMASRGEAGGGIQADLADALGLEYQLSHMNYDRDHWVPSDMAVDEVNRAMQARGASFEVLEETLGGTSLPARVAKILLGVVKFADGITGGAASIAMKVMLVEMLSDESLIEMSMDQLGPGFGEVIVDERNRRVMDDLEVVLAEDRGDDERIAIFYGAAHLPDFAERLAERFDYHPASGPEWYSAITVDIESSPVSQRDIDMIRGMVRRQLDMMQQMNR